MFNFFRRQKPKEDKSIEPGSKNGKDVPKTVLPIRLFKSSDDCKKSPKNHIKTAVSKSAAENERIKTNFVQEPETVTGNPPDSTETTSSEKAPPNKGSPAEVCDKPSLTPVAFNKSGIDTSRLAFFDGLLDPKKDLTEESSVDPKPIDVNTSLDAFNTVDKFVAHAVSPSQGSCKLGLTASVNTSDDSVSISRAAEPSVVLCDSSIVKETKKRTNCTKNVENKDSKTIDRTVCCVTIPFGSSDHPNSFENSSRGSLTQFIDSSSNSEISDTRKILDSEVFSAHIFTHSGDSGNSTTLNSSCSLPKSSAEQRLDSSRGSTPCAVAENFNTVNDDSKRSLPCFGNLQKQEFVENFQSSAKDSPTQNFDYIDSRSREGPSDVFRSSDQGSSHFQNVSYPKSFNFNETGSSMKDLLQEDFERSSDVGNLENPNKDSSTLREVNESFSRLNEPGIGADLTTEAGKAGDACDKPIPIILVEDLDEMGSSSSSLPDCSTDMPEKRVRFDSESFRTSACNGESVKCAEYSVTDGEKSQESAGNEMSADSENTYESLKSNGSEECDGNDVSDDSDVNDEKSDAQRLEDDVFVSGTDEEQEDDVEFSLNEGNGSLEQEQRLNLVSKESSVQDRLHELTTELANREAETIQLRYQLEEAQKQLVNKTWGMDRLQSELLTSHQESKSVKERLRSLENDLTYQPKDANFNEDVYHKKTGVENGDQHPCSNCDKFERTLDAMNRRVKELEEELGNVKRERDKLEEEANSWETEREQEIKIVQQTLQNTEKEKHELRTRFEKEFEVLRTVNTDREQHLLDDFEWKLREVEQACKKRLQKREQVVREQCLDEQIKLKDQIQELEIKIKVHHSHEAELSQLRDLSNEQQRSLKVTARQVEQLQNSEKTLKEEIERLKSLLQKEKTHLATMQGIHNREIAEKERKFQFKLEQHKTEVNSQLDEKVQRECARLRIELDRQHKEERRADLESAKQEMEKDVHLKKQNWDRRMQECIKELEILQKKLANKDKEYKQELENIQTVSDRDIMELRRKLDKMDMSYQEKLEKVQEKCDKEIERINFEREKRIRESEEETRKARSALELEKAGNERELEERLAEVSEEFERRLQQERQELLREKEEALAVAEQRHLSTVDNLRNQLDSIYKSQNYLNNTRQDSLMRLHQEVSVTSESSTTDEGCVRERIQASEDESVCPHKEEEESVCPHTHSQEEEDHLSPLPLPQLETNKSKWKDKERGDTDEDSDWWGAPPAPPIPPAPSTPPAPQTPTSHSNARLECPDLNSDGDVESAPRSAITYVQLDENRERTGNTQVLQTRSSRRKRRSRAQQRARMNVNFAPAS